LSVDPKPTRSMAYTRYPSAASGATLERPEVLIDERSERRIRLDEST
jgi:hypothetical protein